MDREKTTTLVPSFENIELYLKVGNMFHYCGRHTAFVVDTSVYWTAFATNFAIAM